MRAMIGLIIALVIGLLAVIIVLNMKGNASNLSNVTTLSGEISTMTGEISDDFGGYASFANLTTAAVVSDKDAPANMISGNNLIDPWGGDVTVAGDTNPSEYDVTIPDVPQGACSKVASSIGDFVSLTINGGSSLTPPVDPTKVATSCTSGNNSFDFVFGRS